MNKSNLKIRTGLYQLLLAISLWAGNAVAGETVVVEMKDYLFVPDTITITAGTTVRWVNAETRTSHDVVIPVGDKEVKSGRFFPGEHWEYRFDEPGSYPYYCSPHHGRDMIGTVEVIPAK